MTDDARTVLDRLQGQIRDDLAASTRRQWATAGVMGVLILLALGYMGWLRSQLSHVDAESVTLLVSATVQERLPELRQELAARGRQVAPDVIDQANQVVLDSPARLRELFEDRLSDELELVVAKFEEGLDTEIDRILAAEITRIKRDHAELSEAEQLDLLLDHTRTQNRRQLDVATDELYQDYSAEMQRLNDYFVTLQTSTKLSEEQVIQKQILAAWAALVPRHRDKLPLPPPLSTGR